MSVSWRTCSTVFIANSPSTSSIRSRWAALSLSSSGTLRSRPRSTSSSPTRTAPSPSLVSCWPSRSRSKTGASGASTRRMPARASISGPAFGYLPSLEGEALITAETPRSISSSAAIRSTLTWLITATSPGCRRFTRCLVRPPSRAVPTIGTGVLRVPPRRPSKAGRRRRLVVATGSGYVTGLKEAKFWLLYPGGGAAKLGGGEQLARVLGGGRVGGLAAEHAANLRDHALPLEPLDAGVGMPALDGFF